MIVASFLSKVRSRPSSRPRPPRAAEHEPDLSSCCRTSSSTGARARSSSCSRSSTATCVPPLPHPHPHSLARAPPRSSPPRALSLTPAPRSQLGSNNGGWQWSASTGCDPQPYFRIFNPASQSEKVDPDGEYIRHWVPELRKLKGKSASSPLSFHSKSRAFESGADALTSSSSLLALARSLALPPAAIHDPAAKLSKKQILDMGYVMPIVDHAKARTTAIDKYKEAAARA